MKSIAHKIARRALAAAVLAASLATGPALAANDCKRTPAGVVHTPSSVKFELNSAEVSAKDQEQLTKLAQRYAKNKGLEICVIGLTDRSGNAEYNKKLAMQRAEAVADVLKSAGLKDNRYQIVARGQAYGDDSWIGKLMGSKPTKGERRVDVLLME